MPMSIADPAQAEIPAQGLDSAAKVAPFASQAMAVVGVLAVVFSTAIVIAGADRAVSLTDEGLYLLMVDDPEVSIRSGSAFHVLLNPLFELGDKSIVGWRRIRAVIDIGADVLLGISLLSYVRARSPEGTFASNYRGAALVSGITLVGFVSWSWAVNGFGYNEVGAILVTLVTASFLQTIKCRSEIDRWVMFCSFALGIFLLAQFATRWTAGTAVLAGLIVTTLTYATTRKALTLFAVTAFGMAVEAAFLHIVVLDFRVVVRGIVAGTRDVAQDAHSLDVLFAQYARSLGLGVEYSIFFAIALLLGVLGVHLSRGEDSNPILPWVLFGSAVLFVAFGPRFVFGGTSTFTINGWAAALVAMTIVSIAARSIRSLSVDGVVAAFKTALLPGFLLLIPFAAALGTDILLLMMALFSSPLWAAALVVSEHKPGFRDRTGTVLLVGLALVAASAPIFAYQALHIRPGWTGGEQNILVERGRYSGLEVDQATHDFLSELEDLRLRLDPNPTVIPLWSRPGITYALDGTGIGFPWYASRDRGVASATIVGACTDDGFVPPGQIVIVQEVNRADLGPLPAALGSCGINFPEDFTLIDTLVAPGDLELRVFLDDRSG